jgi:hypothetical protein
MFIEAKIKILHNFRNYKPIFETQTNHQFKILKFDNGIEFTSKIFKTHCTTYGIQHIIIYSFQQNRVGEHKNITLVEFA